MTKTLNKEETTQEDIYGITPEIREKYRKKLEQMIAGKILKVFTKKDFDFPKDEKSQAELRPEIDEFLRIREEWRKENRESSLD